MAIDTYDVFAEMDQEVEAAKARAAAGSGNVFFFKLEDGQRALVRFLLDLRECVSVWKHELYNVSTNKYEVSALCLASVDGEKEDCKHCQDAKSNKKLEAVKYFIVPVFVYGIKDKAGNAVTYTNKEGQTHPVNGIRLMQMKATAPLLASLRDNYRELEAGDDFLHHDMTITLNLQNGDRKKPTYTVILKPYTPRPFQAPEGVEVPTQTRDGIIDALMEVWKPAPIENLSTSAQATKPANSAPNLDF